MIAFLNEYSSLLLAVITAVYAFLTWRMVNEMRRAREADIEPYLVAHLIPFGPLHVKLQITNVGRGPAFDVSARMWFEPSAESLSQDWKQPVMLPSARADFKLPAGEFQLEKLAATYDTFAVDLECSNSFGKRRSQSVRTNLKQLRDGWTKTHWLVPPEELPTQLNRIKDEIARVANTLQADAQSRALDRLMQESGDEVADLSMSSDA